MLSHTPLFQNHLLSISDFDTETVHQPDFWPILILCFIVLLLTVIVVSHRRQFTLMAQSLFSQRFYSLLVREGKVLEEPIFALALIDEILLFAFAVQLVLQQLVPSVFEKMHYMAVYGIIVASLCLLYVLKLLCNRIYTSLYDYQAEFYPLNLYKFIFLTNSAITLFPFLLIAQFSQYYKVIYVFIPVCIVLFLIYLYRLFILIRKKINLFQFFIYFCTLEILPYLLVVKLITMI